VTESFGNNGIAFLMWPFSVDAHLDSTRSVTARYACFGYSPDSTALESAMVVATVI
jgi:hypothetical protein